jgi:hypothetical protein
MRSRLLVIWTLVLVTVASAAVQLTVDATGPTRQRRREAIRGSGGSVGRKLPVQVAIETNVSAPDANGRMLVEFVLTNSGGADLTLPVSPNPGDFEPADPKAAYSVIRLGLGISLSKKPGVIFPGGAELYGNKDVPGSLASLAPGDSIRILTRVALPEPGIDHNVEAFEAIASLYNETMKKVNGELVSDSQSLGFARSKEYTFDSLLRLRE